MSLKHGIIGVGICAVVVTLAAGIRSMWVHKNDEDLHTKLTKATKEAAARVERMNEDHREELQKTTWEYSSKLSAKESEARGILVASTFSIYSYIIYISFQTLLFVFIDIGGFWCSTNGS